MHAKCIPWRERLFSHVVIPDDPNDCWLWQGGIDRDGYGYFRIPRKGSRRAHVAMYILYHDIDPGGLHVLHRCDRPECISPAHLFLGTPAENMADRDAKGRQARGERQGLAKLTTETVGAIRARYRKDSQGHGNGQALAHEYGVAPSTILHVVNGRTWKHV